MGGRVGWKGRWSLRAAPPVAEICCMRRLSRQGGRGVIRYPIGSSGQTLVLTDAVLAHFRKHRQVRLWNREAGGQLFAQFDVPEIRIEVATGPRPTDKRGRTYYHPDRRAERKEILSQHRRGFHYVGDWHTHPSRRPDPSWTDVRNIKDCFLLSRHRLAAFVMIIVGTLAPTEGLRG